MAILGKIQTIARYPVKSMRGEELASTPVGLQGLPGDRMFAFVQEGVHSPFPWLTGREHQGLLRYQPVWDTSGERPRVFVVTPGGQRLPIESDELRTGLETDSKVPIRLHTGHRGNHDIAYVSLVFASTIRAMAEAGGVAPDHRRFRMNFVVENSLPAFSEQELVGKTLAIGDSWLIVTEQDKRCVMITFDPETGNGTPAVLKAAGSLNDARVGVYGSVSRAGTVSVGDPVEVLPG